ncbi:hypothetical protein J3A83DRAFT_4371205 [Scleroderma citrinum]
MPPKARTAKSVRFRSSSPDTLMISPRVISKPLPTFDNDDAMAIDEPLPGLSSLTAGHQTWELPSQIPVTISQTVESPACDALDWPSYSPALACPCLNVGIASHITSLNAGTHHTSTATIGIFGPGMAITKPISSLRPIPTFYSPSTTLQCGITPPVTTPVTMLAGPQISVCIPLLASSQSIAAPPVSHYSNAHVDKAQQLTLLLTDVSKSSPATVDLAQDGLIIAAYNHYANTLVEASWQYQLLLERRAKLEAMMQEFQNDNITGMKTKELDNL